MVAPKTLFPNVAAVINLNLTEKTTMVSSLKTNVAVSSPGKLCTVSSQRTGPLHSFSPALTA